MEYLTAEYYNLSLESQAQVLRAEAERWEQRAQQEKQLHGASTTTTSVDSDAMKVDKTFRLMSILAGR
jgi:hypothetical protein